MSAREESRPLHYIHPEHIVGDMHPYYHDGRWYVYYLRPGFHSTLMTTTDLLHWEEVPLTHDAHRPGDPELAPYYVLGVLRDDAAGLFRTYHGWTGGSMYSDQSADLLHWSFAPDAYRVPSQYDRYAQQRDPYVFWNEAENKYWCVMTCKVKGYEDDASGAVGFASSPDLQLWTGRDDLYFPASIREPEVPQVFRLGEKWYLLASVLTGTTVGRPSYWIADQPTGPWTTPAPDSLDGGNLQAANVGWDGQRWLLFGWIPLTTPEAHGTYTWGGHVGFPREVYQLPGGALGTRLEPSFGAAIRGEVLIADGVHSTQPLTGNWSGELTCDATAETGVAGLPGQYDRFDAELSFSVDGGRFALRLGDVIDIRLDAETQTLCVADPTRTFAQLPLALDAGQSHRWHVIVEDDMVELFADDRYSLAARLPAPLHAMSLQVVVEGGRLALESLEVYGLRSML